MNITQIFLTQLFTAYTVWTVLSIFLLVPSLNQFSQRKILTILIIPQLFRYIGVSVAATPVVTSENIPIELAEHIALGDWLTAVLAILAFVLIRINAKITIPSIWLMNIIGFADQVMTMTRATRAGLANYMDAAWYVPTVLLPIMTASHVLIFYYLLNSSRRKSITML